MIEVRVLFLNSISIVFASVYFLHLVDVIGNQPQVALYISAKEINAVIAV